MIGAKEDYVMDVAEAILSVDGIGVAIGTENIDYLTELYNLESIDAETIKSIYAEAKEKGPKYDTLTEALMDVGLLDADALYSTSFNYDSFVNCMISTYQVGTKKTIKELIELDDLAPGAFTFENNLNSIYNGLDNTHEFTSLLEVYNNHGLLETPILPDKTYVDVTETSLFDVMGMIIPQTTTMQTETPMIPTPTESHIDPVSAQEQGNNQPAVGIFGVVFLGNVYKVPVDTAEVR